MIKNVIRWLNWQLAATAHGKGRVLLDTARLVDHGGELMLVHRRMRRVRDAF